MPIPQSIAILGAGNLGSALLRGLLDAGVPANQLRATDANPERAAQLRAELGIAVDANNRDAARSADITILAVKPHLVAPVVHDIADALPTGAALVSLAAAIRISVIEAALQRQYAVFRVMPNIAMTVRASASSICANQHATPQHWEAVQAIFAAVGTATRTEEKQMDVITALAGSGPAFVFTVIESLASGALRMGLPAAAAREIAEQTVLGAAELCKSTGTHPAALRDQVTTPGGTTIQGLYELESSAVRAAFMNAIEAATNRAEEIATLLEAQARE